MYYPVRPSVAIRLGAFASLFLFACGGGSTSSFPGGGSGGVNGSPSGGSSSCSLSANALLTTGNASASAAGQAVYEDRTYDSTGFTGYACLPIRHAQVEVVSGSTVIASAETDGSGNYSVSFTPPGGAVYVRVLTQTQTTYAAAVKDDGASAVYAVKSADVTVAASEAWRVNLVAGVSGAGPSFNVFDNVIKTQVVLKNITGQIPPYLLVYWYDGKTAGTYYYNSGGTRFIHLLGSSTDSDVYDDAVILHETGHYVLDAYSKDTSPGGDHSLTGHLDLSLAWSEGWAGFWSGFARKQHGSITGASDPNPEWYVDTQGNSASGFSASSWEISSPSFPVTGADNELSISNVLWNIYDAGASPKLGLGYAGIWDVIDNGFTSTVYSSFEVFYDYWSGGTGRTAAQLTPALQARSIEYFADQYESDNTSATARTAAKGTSEAHSFFPAADKDWYAITVAAGTTYTFATGSLKDGADTLITLYDTDGATQLAQNDDMSSTTVASKIIYAATVNKTVYLLVEPYRQLAASDISWSPTESNPTAQVKYGGYTLTVQ